MAVSTSRILDLLTKAANDTLKGDEGAALAIWQQEMTDDERLAFDLFLVRMGDELAAMSGSPFMRFKTRVERMANCQRQYLRAKGVAA